jgi:uncharacterized protein YqeY
MNTKERLENALKEAILSQDDLRKRTVRMALSSIRLAEVEKKAPLDEAGVLAALQKEVKSLQESIADAQRAGRPELAAAAQEEIAVLESFLPQPFTPEELEGMARQAVAETGATTIREMGQVMKVLMPRLQGRATGEQASQAVRKLLN